MPDQPDDSPPQPGPDDQTTEIHTAVDDAAGQPTTAVSAPDAGEPKQSWSTKPLHVTRAVATGTAAGILLVGGVAGLAIGATLAGDDSPGHRDGRTGWHGGDMREHDRGGMPERGQGDWPEQPPGGGPGGPGYFGPGGPSTDDLTPDSDQPAPADPSDGTT